MPLCSDYPRILAPQKFSELLLLFLFPFLLHFQSETASSPEEKLSSDESPATVGAASDEGAPKFKSALLQQMMGSTGRLGRSSDKLSESKSNSEEEVEKGSDNGKGEAEMGEVVPEVLASEEPSQEAVKVVFEVGQAEDDQRSELEEPHLEQDREADGSIKPAIEQTEVRTDEAEYSEEKPIIQLNDIVVQEDNQRQADTEPAVGSNQEVVASNLAQPADSKDSVGNGDCVELTDNIATGNGELVSVAATPSSNCAGGVADADSKESLRDGLEQDKDIDTTESDNDAWRVGNTSSVRVDASPLLEGRVEQNGFTRCGDNSDPLLQLDSQ